MLTLIEVYEDKGFWLMAVEVNDPMSPLNGQTVDQIIDSAESMNKQEAMQHAHNEVEFSAFD